jgi:uncharacterized repeat protein (TIGR01451 family)
MGNKGIAGWLVTNVFALLAIAAPAAAQVDQALSDAGAWLASHQNADGSFGTTPELTPRDSGLSVLALLGGDPASPALANGLVYVQNVPEESTHFRSLRIQALARAGRSFTPLLGSLFSFRNGQGFGAFSAHETNLFDTALAVQALATDEPNRVLDIVPLLDYLRTSQNPDGGWGFLDDDPSETYYTTEVLLALASLKELSVAPQVLNGATSFLVGRKLPNGSFGSVLETALVYRALLARGYDVSTLPASPVAYLLSQQLANGSWENDHFTTAQAMLALSRQLPNLTVTALTANPANAPLGSPVTLTATVRNTGPVAAPATTLVIRARTVDGEERATAPVATLAPGAQVNVQVTVPTTGDAGTVVLFALADGRSEVVELDETDNTRSVSVGLRTKADLAVFASSLAVSPSRPEPNTNFTLQITAQNLGETQAPVFSYRVFELEAGVPVRELASGTAGPIDPGKGALISKTLNLPAGEHTVQVILDSGNSVDEESEDNNAAEIAFFVVESKQPDLAIAAADLTVTPAQPTPGQSATASATVRNLGTKAGSALVELFDGDPALGGTLLKTQTVNLQPGASAVVSQVFTAGVQSFVIVAVADRAGALAELDEANNMARRYLRDLPDLAVGVDNFDVSPAEPQSGDPVQGLVTVRNAGTLAATNVQVEVFDGEPGSGGTPVFAGRIASIPAGGNRSVSFTWSAAGGLRKLVAVVDRSAEILEQIEDNNRAEREIAVPRAAGPDLAVSAVDSSALIDSAVTLSAQGTVQVAVTNSGDAAGETFAVRLFEDRDGSGRFSSGDQDLGSATVAGLASGATATVSIPVNAGLEFHRPLIWAEADATDVAAERREDNNRTALFGACETLPPASITPVEEWYVPGIEVETAPVVVQLSDDNGDGRIDSRDKPDVVFHTEDAQGRLVLALSGLDGSQLWAFRSSAANPLQNRLAHLAAADLDGDGVVEVVAVQSNNRLVALDRAGRVRWVSDAIESTGGDWAGSVEIGDLTGDGVPEIVVGRAVLSNAGKRIAVGTANVGRNYNYYGPFGVAYFFDQPHSIIADVDLDGQAEIVAGDALYRLVNGVLTVVWDKVFPDKLMEDGFAAVGNLDADPQAEIVYVSSNQIMVLNHDGSVRSGSRVMIPFSPFGRPSLWGGPPTIADITGDGIPEILVAGDTQLIAYNSGLGTLWRKEIDDIAAVTSVTAFDLDGDGKREVIYLDENYLYVLNGANGATLYQRPNTSKTGSEYPVVADLDNDGSAEILVPSNRHRNGDTSTQGLHALGNPSWPGTRGIWNQYSYHGTNVQLDGTVPASETPAWQAANTWRVNQQMPRRPRRLPNLTLGLPRVGPASSSGVPVTLRVGNGGRETMPSGARVRLYTANPGSTGALAAGEGTTSIALAPGAWQDVELLWQASGDAPRTAFAKVDPDAKAEECDETDNVLAFELTETVLPDLAIPAGGVTVPAGAFVAGQVVIVSVQVKNAGAAASPAATVRLYDGDPALAVVLQEAALAALTPGQTSTVTLAWDTLGASGTHVLHAVADPGTAIAESDETNNEGLVAVPLNAPTLPDLAVGTLQTSSSDVPAGDPVQLTVRVTNRGVSLAGGFAVAFRVNGAEEGRVSSPAELGTGESRDITFTLQTLGRSGVFALQAAADPANAVSEQNETNNVAAASLRVSPATLSLSLKTEKLSYQPGQEVRFQLTATNGGTAAQGATLQLRVIDAPGVQLAIVANQAVTLAPGATQLTFTWNTGAALPAPYAGIAELVVGGAVRARATASFVVERDRDLQVRLFTDRGAYTPGQEAILTGAVSNDSVNEILETLRARFAVLGPTGIEVFSSERLVPVLLPGGATSLTVRWAVGAAPPGNYTASLSVRDTAGILIGFSAAPFQVDDSAQSGSGLRGHLAVSPSQVGIGAPAVLHFDVTNAGNARLIDLPFRFDVLRLADGAVAKSLSVVSSLNLGETVQNAVVLPTTDLAEGEYLVEMTALLPRGPVLLDSAGLSAARAVSIGDIRIPEGDGGTAQATFEAVLSSPSPQPVTVHFATADATATAGSDYTAVAGTLTFAPGETRVQIMVPVHGDTIPEADEVFLLTLSSPEGAVLGDGQALAALADEEGCSSPNLLGNASAEEGILESDLPAWTLPAGAWTRRLGDPVPIEGDASFAALAGNTAELVQEVNLAPFADQIDHQGQTFAVEGFLRSSTEADPARGRVIVEYRDAAGTNVLGSYDSGELASPGVWRAVSDSRMVPAGTRRARVRLVATRPAGLGEVFFDRLGLRSLGVPVLTAEAAQTAEGNTGTTPLHFRASLSCSRPGGVSVSYATEPGTATATDYDPAAGALTFLPGGLEQAVDVAVHGDATDEQDETLRVVFTSGTEAVVLTPQVTGTILDDDGPVTVSIGDVSVMEGDTGTVDAAFTVTLSDESGQEVRVAWATAGGTAAAGTDFVSASGTVIFPPGTTSQTVTVQVKGDLLDEPAESFFVRLSAPFHATVGDGEGEGRIEDNDEVLIAVNDVRLTETDSGTTPATFTVILSVPSVFPVTVQYATANGTALAPADYTAVSGTLTFAPGVTSQTVTVPVVGELVKEPEETFFLRMANPTNALLGDPEGVGTIVDNDGILISVADLTVREGATNSTAAFKLTLSKSFNQSIAVSYQTVDGTATAGADYQAASGTVTFAAGTTTQTVNVTVLPDILEEPLESFSLQIANPTNGALILKGAGAASVIDGDLWTVNGNANDLTIPGCVVLTPDATNQAGTAWRNDRIDLTQSFDKTFTVFLGLRDGADGVLFGLHNLGFNALGAAGGYLAFLTLSPAIGIEVDTWRNSWDPTSDDHMNVDVNGTAVSAVVPATPTSADVEDGRQHDLRVIWNASTKTLDAHFDGNERVVYQQDVVATLFGGVSSVIYGLTAGAGSPGNMHYFCETELCYGTAASPKISVGDVRLTEPDSGSVQAIFPVTLSCPADHPVTVGFTTTDGTAIAGADYLAVGGTLTFQPGETSKSVSVAVLGENLGEADEVFYLDLAGPAGGAVRYSRGTGTIVSDEMGIFAEDVTMVEPSAAGGNVAVRVRLVAPASSAVSVKYATADGMARAGQDYTAVSGTLTFQVGETFKDVFIALAGDTVAEPAEQFFFRLSNPTNGEITDGEAIVQLLDDDDCPSLNLLRNGSIEETTPTDSLPGWTKVLGTQAFRRTGYPGTFDGAGYIMPVDCPEAELRQDVSVSSFAPMIDAGAQRFAFAGYVSTYPDAPYDGSRFIIEYRNAANALVLSSFDSGELSAPAFWRRVADLRVAPAGTRWIRVRLHSYCHFDQYNDGYYDGMSLVALGAPSASVSDVSVVEGSSGTVNLAVPVQLSCASTSPVRLDYLTQDGTAQAGTDYQASFGTLVFNPGETAKSVQVPIFGDTKTEGNETLLVNLASPVNAGIADAQGTVTILEDEVSLSVADVSVVEGNAGTVPALVKVTLSAPSNQVVTADYTTLGDTATGNLDYVETAGTITFNPGETAKTIQVDVIGDTSPEPDEKSRFILSNPVNAFLTVGQASIKIVNDDLGLSIADANVIEGNSGTANAVFNVKLNSASTVAVSVHYATRDASATAGVDYTALSGTLTFAAGETAKTLTVVIKGDTLQETGEIFYVDLSSPVNAAIVDGEGLGSIGDDDACPGPNLLANPGGEEPLVGGKIPGWTEVSGFAWAYSNFQGTYAGSNFMFPGAVAAAELRQDVDLAPYASFIDAGIQRFSFEGYVRSADTPPDPGRVVLEYLDANRALLASFDSGEITNVGPWMQVADLRTAPEGTRWARVRLLGRRISSGNIDAYFDGFLLRSLDTPVAQVADLKIQEGDTSPVTATFTVQLTCPGSHPITLDYTTADATATAPSDYEAVAGTLHFDGSQTAQPVAVSIAGDFRNEIRETFLLRFSHPGSVVVLDPEAVGTILDADPGAPPVPGTDVTYTVDADFDLGIPTSVNHDAPGHDQLQVSAHGGTFPYLWVAESAKGMIVKIDTKTGAILGEYSTNPDQGTAGPDPSRTTVALDGSVWVGNRGDGSVLHVGLPELGQCIDRNGNGVIDTSSALGDVLAWPGTANLSGGVTQAQDECILHFVKVSASIVRHVSVDRDNNVWVSGYGGVNPHVFNLINGDTGQIMRTAGPFACGGYGGLVDGNGIVWSSNSTGAPLRWDPSVNPPTAQSLRCVAGVSVYGLAIDSQGSVWGTDAYSRQVWKISSDGNTISGPYLRSSAQSQGLAVDGNDHVWVSSCTCTADTVVGHFLPNGTFLGNVTNVPAGSTGVAVDADGKIWTANLQGSSAARIDPKKGPLGADGVTPLGQVDLVVPLPGASPYNYSDMTGFVALRSTASSGRWFVIQDAGTAGAAWGMLRWNLEPQGSIPGGGSVVVEVRAADTVPALGSKPYLTIANGVPFVTQGRYLQVRATLKRGTGGVSPVLSDLRVQTAQDGVFSIGDVTVTEGDSGSADAVFTVSVANPVNRDVQVSYSTANGSALAGQDYSSVAGTVTIPYGTPSAQVRVPVIGDTQSEPDEQLFVNLSAPVHATITKAQGVGTILDNDRKPALTATKSAALAVDAHAAGEANPGDVVRYEIRITNTGQAPATDVVFEDPIPASAALVDGSIVASAGTVESTSPLRVRLAGLAAGAALSVRFDVRIADPFPENLAQIANQGQARSAEITTPVLTDDPAKPGAADPTVTPVVAGPPVLTATKRDELISDADGNGTPSPGDRLRYEIVLANSGPTAATEVVFQDLSPAHTSIVTGSVTTSAGTIESQSPVRIAIGTLAPGAAVTVRFNVQIANPVPVNTREISNQGTLSSRELPPVPTDDPDLGGATDPTVTAITAVPKLVAEKTAVLAVDADHDGAPSPGDTLAYTVTVRNTGNTSATAVSLSDPVPSSTALVDGSLTASQGTSSASAGAVRFDFGEIAGGADATAGFRVKIAAPVPAGVREISNQGQVTSTELPPVPTDDPAIGGAADPTVTHISAAPVLVVEKTASLFEDADGDGVASPGGVLLYRITVENRGNTSATQVRLDDEIPAGTAIQAGSVQTSQGTVVSEQPAVVSLGEIAADTQATVAFKVTIDAGFPASSAEVSNQAAVTAHELTQEVPSDDPRTPEPADPTRTSIFITPDISIGDVSVREDAGTAQLAVTLSKPANREVRVAFATADGSAVTSADYTAASGTLTFAPGETEKAVTVAITDDFLVEADESFTVTLSSPVQAKLADAEGAVTILNEDKPPVLAAVKTAALQVDRRQDGVVNPGDVVRYEVRLSNLGLGRATGVVFTDAVPAHTVLVPGSLVSSVGALEEGNPLRVQIGALLPGAAVTVHFDVQVDKPLAEDVTQIANQGELRSNELPPVATDDPAQPGAADPTVTVVAAGPPVLRATKVDSLASDADGDGTPSPGDRLGYAVTVSNSGENAATGVVFQDLIPANTLIVAQSITTSAGTVASEQPVRVAIGDLEAGQSVAIHFAVTIDSPVPAGVTAVSNQGVVLSAELPALLTDDPALAGDSDPTLTAITAAPRLVGEKTDRLAVDADGNGVPSPGDTLEYTVKILNQGNTSALGVSLNDPLPAHAQGVPGSVHSTQGTVASESPLVVSLGEIRGGGASATVTFRVKIDHPLAAGVSQISNQGKVSSQTQPDVLTDDPEIGGGGDSDSPDRRAGARGGEVGLPAHGRRR